MIKAQKSDMFTLSDGLENMKGVAYLTDTDKWKGYLDGLDGALYAIGSPTVELFRASFNAAQKTNEKMTNASQITDFTLGTYGYEISNYIHSETGGEFSTTWCGGIYRKSRSGYWWLASPASAGADGSSVWFVHEPIRSVDSPQRR